MERLFDLLKSGGIIVSQNKVTNSEWIEGKSNNRTFVDKNGFGFIYIPDYKHEV